MSQNPPRIIRVAPFRNFRLYWCYQCQRTVRISVPASDLFCPRCFGQFIVELHFPRPRYLLDLSSIDASPRDRLLEALSLMLRPPPPPISDDTPRVRPANEPRSWIIFRPAPPSPPGRADPGNYFAGPGLDELIEEITQNDRPGPPPAAAAAIDSMATVKITTTHLADASNCPVCKEDFEVGEEAREMPCKHVYHSDCIVPWLRMHNSCPVCRLELPGSGCGGERRDGNEAPGEEALAGPRRRGRWNPFSLLWPFRSRQGYRDSQHLVGGSGLGYLFPPL
ncbi:hypothetical protein H6P81_011033 [Aristolochia fimbriata]|uniref:RING-type E3 ubiquitin transferase n=1 Tax=Aristolochia fimbriata TaxID=158543 RepID=A0AAV7EUV7_ARIFI|nr:hypothetical protein H6P81_011033 [Aristolochia fimbriata]